MQQLPLLALELEEWGPVLLEWPLVKRELVLESLCALSLEAGQTAY